MNNAAHQHSMEPRHSIQLFEGKRSGDKMSPVETARRAHVKADATKETNRLQVVTN
jgi:hypothetical protein